MTLQELADRLLDISSARSEIPEDAVKRFREEIRGTFSNVELCKPAVRKNAARMLHLYLLTVTGEPDEDWGEYASLKDIYDCRICANAIAQVLVKGIMKLHGTGKKIFGGDELLTEEEASQILERIRTRYD